MTKQSEVIQWNPPVSCSPDLSYVHAPLNWSHQCQWRTRAGERFSSGARRTPRLILQDWSLHEKKLDMRHSCTIAAGNSLALSSSSSMPNFILFLFSGFVRLLAPLLCMQLPIGNFWFLYWLTKYLESISTTKLFYLVIFLIGSMQIPVKLRSIAGLSRLDWEWSDNVMSIGFFILIYRYSFHQETEQCEPLPMDKRVLL
jgi:hypothetical protein